MFVVDVVIDSLFILDIGLNFVTAVRTEAGGDHDFVVDMPSIAKKAPFSFKIACFFTKNVKFSTFF